MNLTRFPLFFPEKRTFFLEGAGVFDIAGLANTTDIRPFFSRRIGLVEGITGDNVTVPLRVGVKLTGRESDYNIGVLDVETGSQPDAGPQGGVIDRQNLMAARVSRNIFQQSWIGGIVTHGNPAGSVGNTLIGADARLGSGAHDPQYIEFIARLRNARKVNNLSQKRLGNLLNKPQPFVSKVETCERRCVGRP